MYLGTTKINNFLFKNIEKNYFSPMKIQSEIRDAWVSFLSVLFEILWTYIWSKLTMRETLNPVFENN